MSDPSSLMPAHPMTPSDLPALIAQGESETVEFKRSVAELEQVVETVAALANTRGGLVLIGVGPKGEIAGVDVGQVMGERIANRITGNTDPVIYPSVQVVEVAGRSASRSETGFFSCGHGFSLRNGLSWRHDLGLRDKNPVSNAMLEQLRLWDD